MLSILISGGLGKPNTFVLGSPLLVIQSLQVTVGYSLSDLAEAYYMLAQKLSKLDNVDDNIFNVIVNMDKKAEEIFSFLIEHLVLPRINDMQKKVN